VSATESSVTAALEAIGAGDIVLVVDDEDRENEGDLIVAADATTPEKVAFFLRYTSGVLCASLSATRCDELQLPPMVGHNTEAQRTAFTVSVDLARGVTTGISASDRAATIRGLGNPTLGPADFARPGHIFPLRSREGGVLKRAGHTEAASDLARLAGRDPSGLLCEVVSEDKCGMAQGPTLRRLAATHGVPMISVADLVRHRLHRERLVEPIATTSIPSRQGPFQCQAWRSSIDGTEHVSLTLGDVSGSDPVLVRVHSECLTGDVFGSRRCDCGTQLDDALAAIASAGRGVVVYLRGHEGRGIGLGHKLAAYNLQDAGHDTVDANRLLGLPVDDREYGIGAQILVDLGVQNLRLMTNNPSKYEGLQGYGLEIVERVPLAPRPTPENLAYLRTKRARMGHLFADLNTADA
jgi:3,4-dihydroxy 2-butanone 4-phosphate synthase / GTP cyclohydrolase II